MWNKLAKSWKNLPKKWKNLSKEGKALTIVIAVLVCFMLVFSFVPIMRVSYPVEETYQATETYYVRESYTEVEPYTVLEPYTEIEIYCEEEPCQKYIPINYAVISGQGYNYFGGTGCGVELYIENRDEIGGTFTVEFLLTLLGDVTTTVTGAKYIGAGSTQRLVATYEYAPLKNPYSFSYSVIAPQKPNPSYKEVEVIKYREVIEYGEVTKYRYVPEELTVVKTRTVTSYKRVSLLRYLLSY
jgi:hypothetical protein